MKPVSVNALSRDAFERIFNPGSVAVIGVSSRGNMFSNGILSSLKAIGFDGSLYAVNPRGGEFAGMKIFKSLAEIPEPVDFAIIAVPAERVPEALRECRDRGVAGAEILSAGFSELGTEEGMRLEQEVGEIASTGIRVIGPNCFGIYCPQSGLTLLPGPDLSRKSGPVGFISQSGGMAIDFAHIGKWMGISFSKMVSFGNGVDLRETELLAYLGNDPGTRVIGMYIEGVRDGEGFFKVLKHVAARKPVIICKGGLTEAGSRAVQSHTASLGGSRRIWEAALRQAGAVQVGDLWEMARTCLAFSLLPPRVYANITVAGGGGALGVNACDTAELHGLNVPPLKPELSEAILEHLPRPGSSARNPIDAANPFVGPQAYREVFLLAARDPRVDIQVLIQLLYHYESVATALGLASPKDAAPYRELADAAREVVEAPGKPMALVLPNYKQGIESLNVEELIREARKAFLERGIPVFDDLGGCLQALGNVSRYYASRRAREG